MKLTFIGTGATFPDEGDVRRCSCTMIETYGRYYFVDMGTSVIEDLKKRNIDMHDVQGIFITHPHFDHCEGLLPYISRISFRSMSLKNDDVDTVILLPRRELIDVIQGWVGATSSSTRDDIRYQIVHQGLTFDDGLVRVRAYPNQHCDDSYSFLIECEGKKLLFTGDLNRADIDFPEIAFEEDLDLIVVESTHFSPALTEVQLDKCNVKTVIYNHISTHRDAELYSVMEKPHRYNSIRSYDGMEYIP
ncbi:MAG: ribonuclease Z [Ruminococcaceae bacterium]|nr:ribonuclease Z [Oscillospiraceae bacterium]